MFLIIEKFFTALNAVITLFGGEAIDVAAQLDSFKAWLEALEINVD